MNILIAEDDAITRRRLQHFLEKWDHQVITSENGLDALEHFLSKEIDMVITDWMMPEMDDLELVGTGRFDGFQRTRVDIFDGLGGQL